MNRWHLEEGAPFPLGVSWIQDIDAYNFALYSKFAEEVSLLFFTHEDLIQPVFEFTYHHRRNKSGPIWHCCISRAELDGSHYYAYRIDGPPPGPGLAFHAFDPEKLLLDPRATTI